MKPDPRLDELGERIERISTRPDEVRAPLIRLARPLLRAFGYRPKLSTTHIAALLDALRAPGLSSLDELALAAVEELEADVTAVERSLVVHGRVPLAHAAWLGRLHEVTTRATRAAKDRKDETARRIAQAIDPVRIAAPLALSTPDEEKEEKKEKAEKAGGEFEGAQEPAKAAKENAPPLPEEERLVELELSAIDHLLDAARDETDLLARRRRLLEAARKLLLDAAAALPLARDGVEARQRHLAREIAQIDRLEATGLSPHVRLTHQARDALGRGDRQRLHAALVALDGVALAAGDGERSARTGMALERMASGADEPAEEVRRRSLKRSAQELFGAEMTAAVAAGYAEAREALAKPPKGESAEDAKLRMLALQYMAAENEEQAISALLSVDGCVDVGVPLAPVRVTEVEERVRVVPYPTEDMLLLPARDITDIPHAVIEDPRTVLMALAEGRLLARRFIQREEVRRKRTRLVGEARIYVLDGSSSMLEDGRSGTRARVRDAILLAELGMLVRRYAEGSRDVRIVLHYRYFTKKVWPITRVDSGKAALAAMADVAGRVRKGGTDIEKALLASFEQIREAKASDPDLARAQIVLVTDGDAVVREEVIREAREKVGDLPIAVSVVALGEENPTLRALVARQRARGERAFYHYLDDDALFEICEGKLLDGRSLHVSDAAGFSALSIEERAKALRDELGGLVEELGAIEQKRSAAALEAALSESDAMADRARAEEALGVAGGEKAARGEGKRASREALDRDRRSLEARFLRWFPAPAVDGKEGMPIGRSPDCEAVLVVLSTVAEVVGDLGGTDLARRADAIDLLERLLPDAQLSPARWHAVLRDEARAVAAALGAVHAAVKGART
ncbi:vWA domain-containing protein [Polyangium aurulentum]|uniref:vWA domain-containing protein n=1 Tax=Polyangium aurulentum TaxID=2567896 RepID=UPI00146D789D|nr:vWA domain-containing protein [Polyangium aurulentum]UQA62033.1 VWA domain-containing protein [Polyangium aurulentum]